MFPLWSLFACFGNSGPPSPLVDGASLLEGTPALVPHFC